MNKIYKATTEKRRNLFVASFIKKVLPVLIGLTGLLGTVHAQVTIGATPYTTLQLAFAAINAGTHTGAITVNINANTTEATMAILNSSGTGSSSYTSVLVRPTANVTVTGNLPNAIIQLLGADNVTIDGLNAGSQLTINNSSSSTGAAVVWLGSASTTDGATNNIIKNCIIIGNSPTTTNIGISSSSGTTVGGLAEGLNSNNTYQGNTINTCQIGISLVGPTGNELNNTISNNIIGSVSGANKIGHKGISIFQQTNVLISQNTIFGVTSTAGSGTFQTTGIYVGGTITGGLIERNKISDIKITNFWGCSGIQLESTTAATNITIANNFIFDVTAGGWTDADTVDDGGYGIAISAGSGYNIYYNSIDMSTNMTGSSVAPGSAISAAFWISIGITGTINLKDNIISNRQTTGIRYAIYSNVPNSIFASINYNDYYSLGSLGFLTTGQPNLTSWQAATAQDANSVSVDPGFTTVANLHLVGSSPLNALATPIAGIIRDIDADTRDVTNPDIGADEFTPPNCSANTGGTATAAATTICAANTTTLSATGYAFGLGATYQWQSSPTGVVWTDMPGQTNPFSALVSGFGATTMFRLEVTCTNCCSSLPGYSNTVTITINNPQVTSTTPNSRCGIGFTSLAATAASGTLNWYAASTGGTSLFTGSPFITPVISSTTTFYVSNSVAGCEGLRTPVVATVTVPPVFTSVSPAAGPPRTICGGTNVNLNVTSGTAYTYTWNPGPLSGAAQTVTPASTTTYTVTGNDGTCRRDSAIIITVNPTPTPLTISPVTATVCTGTTIVPITVTGGLLIGQSLVTETFETFPLTQWTVTGTGVTANANTTYFSQGTQSVHLTHSNSIDGQLAMSSSINLSLYQSPKLSFAQICALEPGFDYGYIQFSTDGGASWNDFALADYGGSGTLIGGQFKFDKTSYTDWNTQFINSGSTPGAGPATSLWKTETVDLSSYQSSTNFRVRFRLTADVSVLYFGWLLDDVKITGNAQAPVTWTPCPGAELFSNVGATIPYVCGTPALTVFSLPTVNHVYTATATGGVGCNATATSTINVTSGSPPTLSISASATTICQNDCVTFTASGINWGGNPGFKWFKNGTAPANQINLPLGFNANPNHNPFTVCGLNNGDMIYCQVLSNAGGCAVPNPTGFIGPITITVNPKPTVSIDQSGPICYPSLLTLTTTGTISTYQWFQGGFGSPVGANSPTYNALVPGTYYIIVTSNQGCKDTASTIVTQQTYTINATATNGTISPSGINVYNCGVNQSFTYTANAGGYIVCDVLIDGVSVGTPASPYTFTNITANHTIDVTFCITGCVNPPIADAGPDDSTCANVNFPLAGSLSGPAGITASWSTSGTGTFIPNTNFANAVSYTPSAGDILAGSVNLTLLSTNPSGPPCVVSTSTMTLYIKPIPVITITGQLGICTAGAISTSLTASATIGAGTISGYQWFNPALIGSLPTQVISATGNYSVTASASNGCSSSSPFTIVAYTSPSTPTISGSPLICAGTSTTLTATVGSPGNLGATVDPLFGYQWYNPGSIGSATAQTYNASAPATYTVTATNDHGCLSAASAGTVVTYDNSPLVGAYTIGGPIATCTNYLSFAAAISDLNSRAIGGVVRFDIPAGYTETVPLGGLALGANTGNNLNATSAVAGRSITFQKSGVGANPLLIAYNGGTATAASAAPDGIWSLRGVDNVTIDGIDLADNTAASFTTTATAASVGTTITVASTASVTTGMTVLVTAGTGTFAAGSTVINILSGTQFTVSANPSTPLANGATVTFNLAASMEYGYGLFKLTTTDGTQNTTIRNCTISLKRANDAPGGAVMSDGATGIAVVNSLATNANAAVIPASAAGTNSGNKFYSNIIQNTHTGIALLGYAAATTPFTLGDTGNDVGGIIAATGNSILNFAGAVGSTTAASGIRAFNQWGLNMSNNTINNNNGAGVNHVSILRGIYGQAGTSATVTINNNNITLNSGASTQQCAAIDNTIGLTAAGNTVTISNNTITGSYTTATTGNLTGIINNATAATVVMAGNTVSSFPLSGTGNWVGINNAAVTASLNMNNNTIQNCNITATGTFVGVANTAAGAVANLTISNNTVTGNTKAATATVSWMQTATSTTAIVNDNKITNNVVTAGAGAIAVNCILGGTSAYQFDNNYIFNNSITGVSGGIATFTGYNNVSAASAETITNNIIRKMFITGTGTGLHIIQGINDNTGGSSNKTFSGNTVANLYCSSALSATIYGIRNATGATVNIFKNKIDSLFPGQSATAGSYAAGIRLQSGTTLNVHDNFINLDLAAATAPAADGVLSGADALKGIEHTGAAGTANIYFNTIRLAGSGTATFGSSGIGITGTPTPSTVDLKNNIIVDSATSASGIHTALRRAIPVSATYVTTSNNNVFSAGTPSATHLLYFDGTTGYQTMAAYQAGAGISPRESNSVNLSPHFISTTDLHLVPGTNCTTEGGGVTIATYTTDYDADTRNNPPDIGADEFNGTGSAGTWKGINTDWNDVQNWCDAIPGTGTNVIIPNGVPFYPIITTATPIAKNVNIAAGGSITITGAGKLSIYGTITNAGTFDVVDGTIELPGTTAQTIPAAVFQNNDLKNLIISNTGTSPGVTLGGALNLYGKLSFTGNNKTFATGGFLILKSNAAGTASVGDITNNNVNTGNTVTGDVQVERFIKAKRAWRFLSVPTMNNLQTIHEAWQENQAANAATPAGYGIQIISDIPPTVGNGFDLLTPAGPGVKTYNPVTNNWDGILSTMVPFTTAEGYMAIIRGDRVSNTFGSPVTTTVLRDKGGLVLGTYPGVAIPVPAAQFKAIGNPYASAIDFSKLTRTGGVQDAFYVWDPALGTLGAYQTFTGPGPNYSIAPGGGSYAGGNKFIESGEAFFVHTVGAGTLQFKESAKVDGSYLVTRPGSLPTIQLRTNIYQVSGGTSSLFDGVLSEFDGSYSKAIDELDAVKMSNFGENIAIRNVDKLLSVERMPELTINDTIFYALNHLKEQSYQFEFTAENIGQPGLSGFLEDNYLHTSTLVNMDGITRVDFSVINDPGSYASDRFRLVFKQTSGPVPVTFTSVRANKQSNDILVEWKVQNELNIHHYEVEKSADGRSFNKVNEQAARGTGSGTVQYNWLDTNPWDGDNFYRIRSVGVNSETKYSQIVRVNMVKPASSITVFPNPVREDGMLYVSLSNKAAGNYRVSLVNSEGQVMIKKTLNHGGGSSVYSIMTERTVAHGNYLINIIGDDNVNLTFKIVY